MTNFVDNANGIGNNNRSISRITDTRTNRHICSNKSLMHSNQDCNVSVILPNGIAMLAYTMGDVILYSFSIKMSYTFLLSR